MPVSDKRVYNLWRYYSDPSSGYVIKGYDVVARQFAKAIAREAAIEAVRNYAWWKDGIQYVGSCGKTLAEAIKDIEKEYDLGL